LHKYKYPVKIVSIIRRNDAKWNRVNEKGEKLKTNISKMHKNEL
jgi:hypothetical protein